MTDDKRAAANKNYMSIAVSVLTTSCAARNSGGVARQESNPQLATAYSSVRYGQIISCANSRNFKWHLDIESTKRQSFILSYKKTR